MPTLAKLNEKYTVEAVSKALDVLEVFHNSEELTLAEISERLGLNKSRVFRLLHTLVERGYVDRTVDSTRFVLGLKLLERSACVRTDLRTLCLPYMRLIHEQFNETVNLGILEQQQIIYIGTLESSRPVRMAEVVGSRSPLHSTALGKAIIAFLPEDQRDQLISGLRLPKLTENTITDAPRLVKELQAVRRRGCAIDDRENDSDGFCIAAPIFDAMGRPAAAISVSGPTERIQENRKEISEMLVNTCNQISTRFGFRSQLS
jgi:IclR family transcriptional regulator, KDG regulon repressor